MPIQPLFATYRQGENRVTGSLVAVLERIGLETVEAILQAALEDSDLRLVTFTNQATHSGGGVADAAIGARFTYLFEVKTYRGALDREQLLRHLCALETHGDVRVIALTPDPEAPPALTAIEDPRLHWTSFTLLDAAINSVIETSGQAMRDRERYLLRELQALFAQDGLLAEPHDTAVVAAGAAHGEYLRLSAYTCQAGRAFRAGLTRLAFYAHGAIQPQVPLIRHRRDDVIMSRPHAAELRRGDGEFDQALADHIELWLAESRLAPIPGDDEVRAQVFLLSPPGESPTLELAGPIANDTTDRNGRPCPFTYGQRYVSADLMRTARTTSQLVAT